MIGIKDYHMRSSLQYDPTPRSRHYRRPSSKTAGAGGTKSMCRDTVLESLKAEPLALKLSDLSSRRHTPILHHPGCYGDRYQ
jgi:hypothetical protein